MVDETGASLQPRKVFSSIFFFCQSIKAQQFPALPLHLFSNKKINKRCGENAGHNKFLQKQTIFDGNNEQTLNGKVFNYYG